MAKAVAGAVDLVVRSGPHRGAIETLGPGTYRIGSGLESDFALADAGLERTHCSVSFDGSRLRIAAVGGEAMLGRRRLRPTEQRTVRLPAALRIGSTDLTLRRRDGNRRSAWLQAVGAAAMAAAVVGPFLFYATGQLRGGGSLASLWTAAEELPGTGNAAEAAPAAPPAVDLEATAAALRARLAEAGLSDSVSVKLDEDVITAKGMVDPSGGDRWLAVQTWFDGRFGQRVMLVRQVEVVPELSGPRLSIRAVWTGAVPYIVAGNGEKYGEGSLLDGGWIIERIEQKQIVLRKGDRTLALAL